MTKYIRMYVGHFEYSSDHSKLMSTTLCTVNSVVAAVIKAVMYLLKHCSMHENDGKRKIEWQNLPTEENIS